MRRVIISLIWSMLSAAAVSAGPWPREKGEIFVATTGTYFYGLESELIQSDGALYAEYGLSDRLTLGVSAMDNLYDYTHAYAFIRRAFSPPEQRLKFAASVGLGTSRRWLDWGAMARVDVSVGRSTAFLKPGWWSVTAAIEDHAVWSEPTYKLDATFGLNLTDRIKTFVDVETSHRPGSPQTRTLRTSLAWKTGRGAHLLFGIEAKDSAERLIGLRAGWWRSF